MVWAAFSSFSRISLLWSAEVVGTDFCFLLAGLMETWGPTLRGGAPGRPGKVREDDVEEEDKVPVAEVVVGGERTSGTETGCGVDDD